MSLSLQMLESVKSSSAAEVKLRQEISRRLAEVRTHADSLARGKKNGGAADPRHPAHRATR